MTRTVHVNATIARWLTSSVIARIFDSALGCAEDYDELPLLPDVRQERRQTVTRWIARGPFAVFVAVELFALVLWSVLGRFQWFYYDEWDFLAARKAGDLGDLFRPHNEHWTTVPILMYRALYSLVGLRSYLPYQLVVIVLHLTAASLLLIIMRRAHVQPWLATAAASLFALLGAGYFNIVMAFQVTFTGALVLGLTHLLLADHDGPMDQRDWLGLTVGLLGLMMSGLAVTMVAVVGLAVLLRRGWRLALFHTVPLGTCYLIWLFVLGRSTYTNSHPTRDGMVQFVETGLRATYRAMGQLPGMGLLLAILLVVGFPLAWFLRRRSGRLPELAAPASLLVGSVLFMAVAATGRLSHCVGTAAHSRYIHLIAAMTLPALAVAVDAFAHYIRWFLPVGLALFLVGIPGNVHALADAQRLAKPVNDATRQMMLTLPRDPLARHLRRDFQPESRFAAWVTIGWLRDAAAQHRLAAPPRVAPRDLAADRLRLSFDQESASKPNMTCKTRTGSFATAMQTGDVIGLHGPLTITLQDDPNALPSPLRFEPNQGRWLTVLRNTGTVTIRGTSTREQTLLCVR